MEPIRLGGLKENLGWSREDNDIWVSKSPASVGSALVPGILRPFGKKQEGKMSDGRDIWGRLEWDGWKDREIP